MQGRVTHYWHYHNILYVEGIARMWAVPQGGSLYSSLRHLATISFEGKQNDHSCRIVPEHMLPAPLTSE